MTSCSVPKYLIYRKLRVTSGISVSVTGLYLPMFPFKLLQPLKRKICISFSIKQSSSISFFNKKFQKFHWTTKYTTLYVYTTKLADAYFI